MNPRHLPVLVLAVVALCAAAVSPTVVAWSVRAEVREMRAEVGELDTYVRIVEETRQRVRVEWTDARGLIWGLTTVRYEAESVGDFRLRHADSLEDMLAMWPAR